MSKQTFSLKVNGKKYTVKSEPDEPLLWVLRDDLNLMGSKFGCGVGICGACSVLIDGQPRRSCVVPMSSISNGQKISTIEGIGSPKKLTEVQQAFIDYNAFCCGFCTPGIILAAKALLDENPKPTESEIRQGIAGNLCRCTGYAKIVEAILSTSRQALI